MFPLKIVISHSFLYVYQRVHHFTEQIPLKCPTSNHGYLAAQAASGAMFSTVPMTCRFKSSREEWAQEPLEIVAREMKNIV